MTKKLKITIYFIFSFLLISPSTSDENLNDNEINFYSGMFDFSDDGQRALLFGLQHQNENLIRESVLGEISPVTGFFLTENQAAYLYTGIQAHYKLGDLDFTPSFTPGLYHEGDGKDLGHVIEFKTEVQFSINTSADTKFGFSYNHVSNASLGSKNPGANSYIFNFFKKF
ncbi:MAG: acyloxyacyl hydrolase [Pelagibacteraceae bacterium]|jgi:lipid A 3-O-deacylase|nr:acyloxyacyl hydrolase [Pelagibacteraceae bacterium]|tara:strand:- start:27 stop:536 length:510 start_codon:yes stop_codon:yes gene_type:complete